MTISITQSVNLKRILDAKFVKANQAFKVAMSDEASFIQARTSQGKGVNNQRFKPYSPKYAAFKAKKGRNISRPDLTFTGKMLGAITSATKKITNSTEGAIFFNSPAQAVKALGNNRLRPFFGIGKERTQVIIDKIRKALRT